MKRRGPIIVAALAALVAALPAGARLLDVGSLDDTAGDGSPDITRISAGSNARAVTFIVELANKTELAENESIAILIDTDMNEATGLSGMDFVLFLDRKGAVLARWDGTQLVDAASKTAYGYSYKGFRAAVDRAELGLTSGTLRFAVITFPAETSDAAPDDAVADYVLSNAPLALTIAKFTAANSIVAGRKFTTSMQVRRDDLDEISSAATRITCTARYGTKTVKATPSFPAESAICSGTVPRAAKGKTMKVTTTFELDGARVTRTATIRVR